MHNLVLAMVGLLINKQGSEDTLTVYLCIEWQTQQISALRWKSWNFCCMSSRFSSFSVNDGSINNKLNFLFSSSLKNWGSFYAFALPFESLHVRTDRRVNTNARLMQTHTRRHYTTTVQNRFANAMQMQSNRKCIKGAPECRQSPFKQEFNKLKTPAQ